MSAALLAAMLLVPMGLALVLIGAFRRRLRIQLVGAACFGFGLLLYFSTLLGEFGAADACLDGGGRWNYDERVCEFSDPPAPQTNP